MRRSYFHARKLTSLVAGFFVFCMAAAAQANLNRVEYYYDVDPGFGKATPLTFTSSNNLNDLSFNGSLNSLTKGVHILHIRALDDNGSWSFNNSRVFFNGSLSISGYEAGNVVQVEYYLDTDPGFGNGVPLSFSPSVDLSNLAFNAGLAELTKGVHLLHIRSRDSSGSWSFNNSRVFFNGSLSISGYEAGKVVQVEYYLDTDPGFGNGVPLSFSPSVDLSNLAFNAGLAELTKGVHLLHIRSRDSSGSWSFNNVKTFYNGSLPSQSPAGNLIRLEYFIDTDPGFGNATPISLPDTTDAVNVNFSAELPLNLTETTHVLYVRALDDWGITAAFTFTVNAALPISLVSFSGETVKYTSLLNWETSSEQNNDYFEIQRSNDGVNFNQIGQVPGHGTTNLTEQYSFTDLHPELNGINYYRLGQVDFDGHTSFSNVIALRFDEGPLTFQLYPNPVVSGTLHLGIPIAEDKISIEIFSSDGKLLISRIFSEPGNRVDLDVSGLTGGLYLLKVTEADGVNTVFKFIKQ